MQKSCLKVEEKELDFVFEVVNIQFNQLGQYGLVLTVENPLKDESESGVKLRINDGDVVLTSTVRTDTIEQTSLDEVRTCMHNKFVFTLPKGFCKNDKNHDVRLKVEALRLTDSEEKDGTKAGEGLFAIYPRTNAPRINLYAGRGEELYQYSGIMTLLRMHNDYLSMHCGRLVYTVAFHEARPFLKVGGSSCMPSLPGSDSREGEPSPALASPLRVPTPTLGSSLHLSPRSATQELASSKLVPEPRTHRAERTFPHPEPESRMDTSAESLPSTPRSGAALSPELSTQNPAAGAFPPLGDTPAQTPDPIPYKHVIESPCKSDPGLAHGLQLPSPGQEAVTFILHGATNLPSLSDGGVPQPFVIVKSGEDEARGRRSRTVTRCTQKPTHCPSWGERLSVTRCTQKPTHCPSWGERLSVTRCTQKPTHCPSWGERLSVTRCTQKPTHCPSWGERLSARLPEQQARGEVVVLSVADGRTQELLAHYRLPVGHLQPFHHYHLELVQAHRSVPSGVSLYATVVRTVSILPRQPHFSFTGFEVLLQAMESPLKEPAGPLFAVARVVPDYHSYSPRAAGVAVTTVRFPQPSESTFHPPHLCAQGQPQISQAGFPEERPVWNHGFLFLERDCATMFGGAAALVLEFYTTTTVQNAVSWRLRSPLAFSSLPLQQPLYWTLMSERGRGGVRVEKLSLRGSSLQTTMDTAPSVSIVLRLIGSERPDSLLSTVEAGPLASLDPETLEEAEWAPAAEPAPPLPPQTDREEETTAVSAPPSPDHHTRPRHHLSLQRDGYGLPSHDALAQILPDYQHLFNTDKPPARGPVQAGQQRPAGKAQATTTQSSKPENPSQINQTYQVQSPHKRPPLPDFEDEPHIAGMITDLQTKEVENYRTAMRKMAEDIIALRSQMVHLESDNSQLRSDLSLHQDLGRDLLNDADVDVMTKAEIVDRIASLKFKLASETSKAGSQRDKIQQLQNELIMKNDSEKELLRLQRAHQQQQATLQRYQGRVAQLGGLEATVKQQEKVIEKMEKILDSKLTEKNKENSERKRTVKKQTGEDDSGNRKAEMESALAAENSRLRLELEKNRHQPAPIVIQQQPAQEAFPDKERLSLMSKLEKAEARIRTLETQLVENSKRWGRQKQDMLTRLSEQDHGFARTTTTILHGLPMKSVSESLKDRGRRRQLKTMK